LKIIEVTDEFEAQFWGGNLTIAEKREKLSEMFEEMHKALEPKQKQRVGKPHFVRFWGCGGLPLFHPAGPPIRLRKNFYFKKFGIFRR
jgi:hypothetical protein